MVHFSASPKNEPHSPSLRERSLFTSRKPSGERVISSYTYCKKTKMLNTCYLDFY
ncbi:MAG: hypothetical protein U5L45_19585 [Saprospiraceae bacterium]|nr:hypothetical protein [Saprospiraceae bacterium]